MHGGSAVPGPEMHDQLRKLSGLHLLDRVRSQYESCLGPLIWMNLFIVYFDTPILWMK